MSDLKYQKGEWYHVQEDGSLKLVDYDKEVEEYYKNLKYAKHHCSNDEDPYEITDRVFTDALVANNKNN